MLLRRGFTVLKIILSSYYRKVHAFGKGVQAFEKGFIFLENGFTFIKIILS